MDEIAIIKELDKIFTINGVIDYSYQSEFSQHPDYISQLNTRSGIVGFDVSEFEYKEFPYTEHFDDFFLKAIRTLFVDLIKSVEDTVNSDKPSKIKYNILVLVIDRFDYYKRITEDCEADYSASLQKLLSKEIELFKAKYYNVIKILTSDLGYDSSSEIPNKFSSERTVLRMNLNLIDLVTLFAYLYKKKIIDDDHAQSDVARFVEENFMYGNQKEKKYKSPGEKLKSKVSDFLTNKRVNYKSRKRLHAIFSEINKI